jgi:hypothetical protein
LALYWTLLAEFVVIQVEDIILAFSVDLVGFPSLSVVGAERGER